MIDEPRTAKVRDPVCGMEVSPAQGLRLEQNGETFYFCSQHCLDKYKEGSPAGTASCCAPGMPQSFAQNKTVRVAALLIAAVVLSYVAPVLVPFREALVMYVRVIWWAVLLGLVLGGAIDHFIPREYVSHILARREKRSIVRAVMLGFLMSACSHGILALAIQLYKKGASTASVIAFLLASPWANLPLTIMLVGFFGVGRAAYIIFSAIVIAIVTGLIYQVLEKRGLVETNPNSTQQQDSFSIRADLKRRWAAYRFSLERLRNDARGVMSGSLALADMVLWWMLIGVGLASFAGAYVPQDFFHQYMGPTVWGMIVTLGLATVIEVCSEGSSPMAFEIFRQTGAVGNSFVFLMAGVVTDYTEIGLLWHNIGRKAALWLPVISVPQVLLLGLLANIIF